MIAWFDELYDVEDFDIELNYGAQGNILIIHVGASTDLKGIVIF